jgi:hypothetical protein
MIARVEGLLSMLHGRARPTGHASTIPARMTTADGVFEPAPDLAALALRIDEMEHLLALAPDVLAAVAPSCSGWSSEQHLAHVALANELVLRNLKSLAEGQGLLIVRGGEPLPGTLQVLATGRIPRGQAQAPRMVRPPARVQPELLRQWLADGRAALGALDPRTLVASELKIPHQVLGPLDAPQWARFGLVHTEHHLAIVREILG